MTQRELNRAVAQRTGETMQTIRQLGFTVLGELPAEHRPVRLDWDEIESARRYSVSPVRRRAAVAS